jgi:RNA polymerase sigma-70 factor (ECF subfamily)
MNTDALFRNYYRPLCIYALHYLHDVEQVEDVVQDCFVRLLEATNEPQNSRAWLYTAVRNRCIDLLRQHNPLLTDIQPKDLDGLISDDEAQERSFSEARLWEAIDGLPSRCREIFLLSKRDGLTYREIAQRLGLSEKTVEHQVSKALKRLRGQQNDFFFIFFL